jgi:hypothetical protein
MTAASANSAYNAASKTFLLLSSDCTSNRYVDFFFMAVSLSLMKTPFRAAFV